MFDTDTCFNESFGLTDEELAAAAKKSKSAANALVLRYYKLISFKAGKLSDKNSESEDLFQEGLIGLIKAVDSFDADRGVRFSTYAGVCIMNRMKAYLARSRKDPVPKSIDDPNEEQIPDKDTPESILADKEVFSELWYAVDNILSDSERQVFCLCIRGHSYAETAGILGISVKSVDNAMQRSRRKIRGFLSGVN